MAGVQGEEPPGPAQPGDREAGGDTAERQQHQDGRGVLVGLHPWGTGTVSRLRDQQEQTAKPLAQQPQVDQHRTPGEAAREGRGADRAEGADVPPPDPLTPT